MPGVIMENERRNGSHTNHDRDQRPNGINGASHAGEKAQDKGIGRAEPQQNVTPISPMISNGLNGNFMEATGRQRSEEHTVSQQTADRMHELPPEIAHITEGYMSLSTLLSRLAQKTHNEIGITIRELAQMPVPASAAAVNGNASHISTVDDNSVDNINKKLRMLKFTQDAHAEWTKALVIAEWSRNSEDISKMIDLRVHLFNQSRLYEFAVDAMIQQKRGLYQARLPSPDLKTALEVLTTGKASWMPELGYIQPPALTAKEILKSLENLNTLLSIRLNLHDYDNIPFHFMNYKIHSGRVTFKVAGEFEIDLTIADEDPDTQFWFIDLRFSFGPSSSNSAPQLRYHIETRVNDVLLRDGLAGCYKYLHEMVLTHKITEFRRQAFELARGNWMEGLKVELLNRTLSIQYWLDRYGKGPKSWLLLGVHSGRPKHGRHDPKTTSRLSIRWFRDAKEVKDVDIELDTVHISTEELLKHIIAKHVAHILTSIYENLRIQPLFAEHDAALSLLTSLTEPADSELHVQLTQSLHVTIRIEPVTGRFIFGPASPRIAEYEYKLNTRSQDPSADAHNYIEMLRCVSIQDEIQSLGMSVGWIRVPNPGLRQDEMKPVMPKDTLQVCWFRRTGWAKDWHLAVSLSMSGERWWLLETAKLPTGVAGLRIASSVKIPIKVASPTPTYAFLSTLNVFAAALVSHYSNLKALHTRRALHMLRNTSKPSKGVALPAIYVRLSELLPSKNKSSRTGNPWAKDVVKLTFQGLEIVPREPQDAGAVPPTPQAVPQTPLPGSQKPGGSTAQTQTPPSQDEIAVMITEARMIVPLPKSLTNINEMVDRDIAFHTSSGSFAFRLRSRVGESVIPGLIERAVRVERLVEFVQVLQKHERSLKCETVSLSKISFRYGDSTPAEPGPDAMNIHKSLMTYKAVVDFGAMDNIITLVLERGNPHLRILDHLTKVLNDKQGLDGVATLLPLTLPVLRSFDAIEIAWTPLAERGESYIHVRAAEWYVIRYNVFQPVRPESNGPPKTRKIMFEVRMRQRKGVPWWYVRRTDDRDRDGHDLDLALKPVWNSAGSGWQGMRVSGVAQASGIEELLGRIDEVVREVASKQKAAEVPAPAASLAQAQVRAPTATQQQRQQPNQRQQQPTPNQSQSQGRNNPMKREIVEID